eukprot:PLAT15025.1.p1 GENE.PLAT15025.1~~PLAT15025.1.p1  ORF type:complete len:335 (+),score=143.73 PLAT15025.1:44-1006(+)
MARAEEKSHAMLNRWLAFKSGGGDSSSGQRPFSPWRITRVSECERWRRQLVTELTKKIGEIQNSRLGEHRIRDLNDEINGLLKEKWKWEKQIRNLGGPDYRRSTADAVGATLPGSDGHYKYFGAARDLPGVRELFEEAETAAAEKRMAKRTRRQLNEGITPEYYGFRYEDSKLLLAEGEAERQARKRLMEDWRASRLSRKRRKLEAAKAAGVAGAAAALEALQAKASAGGKVEYDGDEDDWKSDGDDDEDAYAVGEADGGTASAGSGSGREAMKLSVIPSQEEIEKLLLARKKALLMEQYASGEQIAAEAGTKRMLNVKT